MMNNKKKWLITAFLIIFIIILVLCIIFIPKLFNSADKFLDNKPSNNFYYTIENFLNNEECNLLINDGSKKLERSYVMGSNNKKEYENQISNVRTSSQSWLNKNDIKYKNILTKVNNLVNSFLNFEKIKLDQYEDIQVVNYKENQEYKPHYDICHPDQCVKEHKTHCEKDYERFKSLRYITVLIYLNDDFSGGETFFPKINLKIKPQKGKVLLFFNCNPNQNTKKNGKCDVIQNSEHGGLPVLKSNNNSKSGKWIANFWIRTK